MIWEETLPMPSNSILSGQRPQVAMPPGFARGGPDGDSAELCRAVLDKLLRQTVISRLRLAHIDPAAPLGPVPLEDPAESAAQLAGLLRRGTQRELDERVELLLEQGDIDTLFMDILPAVDVAVRDDGENAGDSVRGGEAGPALACWRLQEMIERLSARFQAAGAVRPHGRRVLLAPAEPFAQHIPLLLAGECLTREGWDVWSEPRDGAAELGRMVAGEWFAMVTIEAGTAPVDSLARIVRGLRRASCNDQIRVLVISGALARRPDRLARLGADAAASGLRHACAQAQRLLALLPARF
jgi:hypothetical protein